MQRSVGIVACGAYLPRSRLERGDRGGDRLGERGRDHARRLASAVTATGTRTASPWRLRPRATASTATDRGRVGWTGLRVDDRPVRRPLERGRRSDSARPAGATATLDSGGAQARARPRCSPRSTGPTRRSRRSRARGSLDRRLARLGSAAEAGLRSRRGRALVGAGSDVIAVNWPPFAAGRFRRSLSRGRRGLRLCARGALGPRRGLPELLPKAIGRRSNGWCRGERRHAFHRNCPAAVAKAVAKSAGLPDQSRSATICAARAATPACRTRCCCSPRPSSRRAQCRDRARGVRPGLRRARAARTTERVIDAGLSRARAARSRAASPIAIRALPRAQRSPRHGLGHARRARQPHGAQSVAWRSIAT